MLLVQESYGLACTMPKPSKANRVIRPVTETLKKHDMGDTSKMVVQPHAFKSYTNGKSVRSGVKFNPKPYSRTLVIYGIGSSGIPSVVGWIAWRKSDGRKILLVRRGDKIITGPKIPQTKRTKIPQIAQLLGYDERLRLTLKDYYQTGRDGGTCYGAPRFNSGSIAGNMWLI